MESAGLARAADGIWKPLVTTFALSDAAAAHRALTDRATVGKVVLVTDAQTR